MGEFSWEALAWLAVAQRTWLSVTWQLILAELRLRENSMIRLSDNCRASFVLFRLSHY